MLEPLTILGVAAAAVQLVDFAGKILSGSHESYHSLTGLSEENSLREMVAGDLKSLCEDFANFELQTAVDIESAGTLNTVQDLTISCRELASELTQILNYIKVKGNGGRVWQSVKQAMRGLGQEKKLQDITTKITKIQGLIDTHLLFSQVQGQSLILNDIKNIMRRIQDTELKRTEAGKKMESIASTVHQLAFDFRHNNQTGHQDNKLLLSNLLAFMKEHKDLERLHKIIDSLCFEGIKARHSSIPKSYEKTFEWIFDGSTTLFPKWLKSQGGIFWIAGKPGSGKSTLMKFLSGHQRTREFINRHDGILDICIVSHFFWSSGSALQKSIEGLLRTLLHQVLRKCPDLIPELCSQRWLSRHAGHVLIEPWSHNELLQVFERLSVPECRPNVEFVFFIDGLDEFGGSHRDVVEILQKLAISPHFKFCVSSRQDNIFVSAFQESSYKLFLQDLTRDDIRQFTEGMLTKPDLWRDHIVSDKEYGMLVTDIVERAAGVFLWVFLVVRELLDGLTEGDDVFVLRKRLDTLPEDLEDYFNHILSRVHKVYREESGKLFQMATHATAPLSIFTLDDIARERDNPNYTLEAAIASTKAMKTHEKRLNARCKGLLELRINTSAQLCDRKYSIEFLHRTARGFIQTSKVQKTIRQWTPSDFDAQISLCRTILCRVKSQPIRNDGEFNGKPGELIRLIDEFMFYARQVEIDKKYTPTDLIQDLESSTARICGVRNTRTPWTNSRLIRDAHSMFLTFAIQSGLVIYLSQYLQQNPDAVRREKGRPLFDYSLQKGLISSIANSEHRDTLFAEMVQLLLDAGCDPREIGTLGCPDWIDIFFTKARVKDKEAVERIRLMLCRSIHQRSRAMMDPPSESLVGQGYQFLMATVAQWFAFLLLIARLFGMRRRHIPRR